LVAESTVQTVDIVGVAPVGIEILASRMLSKISRAKSSSRARLLKRRAETEILAYLAFPREHHRSVSSTNAIELVNAKVDRRAKVVGILPNSASLLRLGTAVLQEQKDEWRDGKRHFSRASLMQLPCDGQKLLTNPLSAGLAA
jgi:transposase-like protein